MNESQVRKCAITRVCKELFYWSAVPLPCSARAYLSLKEWQKRRARERKREKGEMLIAKEWDHQWWLLGVYWIIDNVMTRRSRSNHCHPKLSPLSFTMKKAKKNKKWREKIVDGLSVKPYSLCSRTELSNSVL